MKLRVLFFLVGWLGVGFVGLFCNVEHYSDVFFNNFHLDFLSDKTLVVCRSTRQFYEDIFETSHL